MDIDNFFCALQHSLIFEAWNWLEKRWRETKGRYKYIFLPSKQRMFTASNDFFMRFGHWKQIRTNHLGLRRNYREKCKSRFSTHRTPPFGYIAIAIEDIGKAIRLDLHTAVAMFGSIPIIGILGSAQGSPLSVFCADLVATFLEERAWAQLHTTLTDVCNAHYVRFLRMRWVDDILTYVVSSTPFDETKTLAISQALSASYHPFSLKIEDPLVFVGFQHQVSSTPCGHMCITFAAATRPPDEQQISMIPRFVHGKTNTLESMTRGVMKGAIIRCMDSASSVSEAESSIKHLAGEFCIVGHNLRTFRRALWQVSAQYTFMQDIARNMSEFHRRWT